MVSALSTKEAIFFALLVISLSWWSVRFLTKEQVRAQRQKYEKQSIQEYFDGNAAASALLEERVISLTDSMRKKIIHLMHQAAAYGKAGKYGKQLQNHLRAKRLAERYNLDTLEKRATVSIGNIYAACRNNAKFCKGINGHSFLARWRAIKPIALGAVALFCFCLYLLAESRADRTS